MRRLNPLLRPLILFALSTLLATCKWAEPTYDQPKPVDNAWRPYVVKATMPGVSDENIAVDTALRTLTVTLPENYSLLRADINLTLSCDSCAVVSTSNKTILPVFLPGLVSYQEQPVTFELKRMGYNELIKYALLFKPTGSFEVGPLTEPVTAERGGYEYVSVPVINVLDGIQTKVIFTSKATGTSSEGYVNFCDKNTNDCTDARADRVWLNVGSLPAGDYSVRLTKADGRAATAGQVLRIRRGQLRFDGTEPAVSGARTIRIHGLNLYNDESYELLISNAQGYAARLPVINASANSQYAEAALPPTISPGYYRVQLAKSTNPLPTVRRLTVLRSAQQPYLTRWRDSLATYVSYYLHPPQPTTTPIELMAGRTQYVNFDRYSPILKHEIRLTPVADNQPSVSIPVKVDRQYLLLGTEGSTNTFVLPATVQPGRYRLTLLVYKDETTFEESEPLEREIRIR